MDGFNIYMDIAERTGGDIYIGVVGPVRTGKSTFIKRFMDTLVLPNIADGYDRERTRDELPQSASGRTVMTTEPKFIPDSAVSIKVADGASLRVKMIDCVGYIVPEAMGTVEEGQARMVMTPWSEEAMPFGQAAEYGTRKVITDHSTIGVVVTTDGTIGEIPRESYVEAERRVITELKEIAKPFAVVLNSANPAREESVALAYALEEEYGVPVALVNVLELDAEDIRHIIEMILLEFPVRELGFELPPWYDALDGDHWLVAEVTQRIRDCADSIVCAGDISGKVAAMTEETAADKSGHIKSAKVASIDLGTGKARAELVFEDGLYYKIIGELTGFEVSGEEELISLLRELAEVKRNYDKVAGALADVNKTGYGIVTPDIDDLRLEEPEIIKQPGGYGVRLKAAAPSIHMIKAEIETEINPVVGSEQQSEDLIKFLMREFEEDPRRIWSSNIFGKTLHELVTEGLHTKLSHMPEEARVKLGETLQRIINEGSGGLICIIL